MMRYLIFPLILLLMGCKKQSPDNIEIVNDELRSLIHSFYDDAIQYSDFAKNNVVSISIWQNNDVIYLSLNSFKSLKKEHYIGRASLDTIKVLFYTNDIDLVELFVNMKSSIKNDGEEINANIETYNVGYIYNEGKFKMSTPNNDYR